MSSVSYLNLFVHISKHSPPPLLHPRFGISLSLLCFKSIVQRLIDWYSGMLSCGTGTQTGTKTIQNLEDFSFVPRKDVLSCYLGLGNPDYLLHDDRARAVSIMSKALEHFLKKAYDDHAVAGAIGMGGSGGTSLLATAFRTLPVGVPKVIVSTVASGQTQPYIGTSDLVLMPSVADICGINTVSRVILSNAGSSFVGMVLGSLEQSLKSTNVEEKPTVGITMFGVITTCRCCKGEAASGRL